MVAVLLRVHFFPGLCLLILGLGLQFPAVRWLLDTYPHPRFIWLGAAASTALLVAGYLLEFQRVLLYFPVQWWTWLECASLVETMWLIGLAAALLVWKSAKGAARTTQRSWNSSAPRSVLRDLPERSPQFNPARRKLLQTAGAALCLTPLAGTAF